MSLHIELQYYERAIIFCNLLLIAHLFRTDTSAENAGYQQLDTTFGKVSQMNFVPRLVWIYTYITLCKVILNLSTQTGYFNHNYF